MYLCGFYAFRNMRHTAHTFVFAHMSQSVQYYCSRPYDDQPHDTYKTRKYINSWIYKI